MLISEMEDNFGLVSQHKTQHIIREGLRSRDLTGGRSSSLRIFLLLVSKRVQ